MIYPEDFLELRHGQVEIYYVQDKVLYSEPTSGTFQVLIKTYQQTVEEAAGYSVDRHVFLLRLEGTEYSYNGEKGVYKNVGSCDGSPREYAVTTTLILNPFSIVTYDGDWDYKLMIEKIENDRKCFPKANYFVECYEDFLKKAPDADVETSDLLGG